MFNHDGRRSTGKEAIRTTTTIEEVISMLAKRGCPDLTESIDLDACDNFPRIGGGFCDVYRGALKLTGEPKIAIKTLRVYDALGDGSEKEKVLKRAARELYHWAKLKHRNVVPLEGLAIFRGCLSMISQWMENGTLPRYLRSKPSTDRIKLCIDICAGLCYIHANGMVHGDLKAENVLISPGGDAMITDFGTAQLKNLTLSISRTDANGLSLRWAAAELLDDGSPGASKEADVYAYGMTVLEIFTGQLPFEGYNDTQVMCMVLVKMQIPPRPDTWTSESLWAMLNQCWSQQPSGRPAAKHILHQLLAHSPSIDSDLDASEDLAVTCITSAGPQIGWPTGNSSTNAALLPALLPAALQSNGTEPGEANFRPGYFADSSAKQTRPHASELGHKSTVGGGRLASVSSSSVETGSMGPTPPSLHGSIGPTTGATRVAAARHSTDKRVMLQGQTRSLEWDKGTGGRTPPMRPGSAQSGERAHIKKPKVLAAIGNDEESESSDGSGSSASEASQAIREFGSRRVASRAVTGSARPPPGQATPTGRPFSPSAAVHNAWCDNCGERIRGVRHKCLDCDDFDFCDACRGRKHFDGTHQFYTLVEPGEVIVRNVNNVPTPGLRARGRPNLPASLVPPAVPAPPAPIPPPSHHQPRPA